MILIHSALLCEAQSIIELYKLIKTNSNPKIYSNDSIIVLIGGIGKINTITSLEYIFSKYTIKKALNIGIVGCSKSSIKIGELFCTNKHLTDIEYCNLVTVDIPQTTPYEDKKLFDMEGKYFENVCLKYLEKSNIYIFKVVSDHLNISKIEKEKVKQLIKKNMKHITQYL